MSPARRSLLVAGAALPFLPAPSGAAGAPGRLVFGLSCYRRPSDPPPIAPWANAGTAAAAAKLKSTAHLRSFGLDIPKIDEPLAAGPAECDAAKRRGSYAELQQECLEQN